MLIRFLALSLVISVCWTDSADAQFPTPGEDHKLLMREVGDWTFTGKMMAPQGTMEFKGEEKVVAVGGFWTVSHYSSDFMGGMKGSATIGFDPKTKKYVGTWVDSLMPSPTQMKGTYDKEAKTMTYDTVGVGMDGKPMPGKIMIHYKDDNSHTFTMMHKDPTGQSDEMVKTMEMNYFRKNSDKSEK